MSARALHRRYGHAETVPDTWHSFRTSVETHLYHRFVGTGMARAPARDVAASVVAKAAKELKKLYGQGRLSDDAAAGLYARRLFR